MSLVRANLRAKLVLIFLAVALTPILLVGVATYRIGRSGMEERSFHMLSAIREMQSRVILGFLNDQVVMAKFLSDYNRIPVFFQLRASQGQDSPSADGESEKQVNYERVNDVLTEFVEFFKRDGFHDVLLLRPDGQIIYSVRRLSDLDANVQSGSLKDSGLAQVWRRVVKTGKHAMTDYSLYQPTGTPCSFVAAPVFTRDKNKTMCGVLALRMGSERVNEIMRLPDIAGRTAETYLVGPDRTMRSQSRFVKESTILKTRIDTNSVKLALEDKAGRHMDQDYRGVGVLSAYGDVKISEEKDLNADFDWALLAEIERSEAERSSVAMAWTMLIIGVVIAAIVAILALLLAKTLARPIALLADAADAISKGDLTTSIPEFKREDELGKLGKAFNSMVESLRAQIGKVLEGVNVLSASAAQIGATVSQVAAGASETSAAVTQTSATVEQVRQAARLASEKARGVAEGAHEAAQVSEVGKRAAEDTIGRINLIRDQMESIGETVVRLSEQSQSIEKIVGTVQDLADQSNLLAVNASIEAARAGEYGKGFSVVSQEIKSLADQSREATQQIRAILEETQKWVSAVVMATEQGGKAVQSGVEQSRHAGAAIAKLAGSVVSSSQDATVIQSTSDQQFTGIDQVSGAMASIEQAMRQISESTSQMEEAAQRIEGLGENLRSLVRHYRV